MTFSTLIAKCLVLFLAPTLVTHISAQISQAADYFGKIGTADFRVSVSDDGGTVNLEHFSAGLEQGSGRVGANSTATFNTNRNRPVSVRLQGTTISGTLANQTFTGTKEENVGPLAVNSGVYWGSLTEINTGRVTTSTSVMRLFPSGRSVLFISNPAFATTGVGMMAANGVLTLSISSNVANTNGDSLRFVFNPDADVAQGTATSSFFPRNDYSYTLVRRKAATLINVATRGTITPTQSMTAGFVVTGGSKTVLVRVVGPTLGVFGVTGANTDPRLTLFSGQTTITSNDNWGDNANATEVAAASLQAGAFALTAGSRDAAILVQLQAGAYTAQASSVGAASGDALIEVYEITK